MNKYIALLAIPLFGCASSQPVVKAVDHSPITIELREKQTAEAIACSDDLDCAKRLTGLCKNGYHGSMKLLAENERRVGVAYACITDEEVQEQAREEQEYQQRLAARIAEQKAEAAKKAAKKSK